MLGNIHKPLTRYFQHGSKTICHLHQWQFDAGISCKCCQSEPYSAVVVYLSWPSLTGCHLSKCFLSGTNNGFVANFGHFGTAAWPRRPLSSTSSMGLPFAIRYDTIMHSKDSQLNQLHCDINWKNNGIIYQGYVVTRDLKCTAVELGT